MHVKFEPCIFKIKWVMSIFCLSRWCKTSILLKFWDFWLMFCMWPLSIPSNKCYLTTWGQKWLLPWFLRGRGGGGALRPPHAGSHRIWYPIGGRANLWRLLSSETDNNENMMNIAMFRCVSISISKKFADLVTLSFISLAYLFEVVYCPM